MRKPYQGSVELHNGLIINWLRFAKSEDEAIHLVVSQLVHVKSIEAEEEEGERNES